MAGSKQKILNYFLANIGTVLESRDIQAASGGAVEWARRVRELRNEEGYQILTHKDRSDLKPNQYLLETDERLPAFEREISKETRSFVLDRNGFTCQMCGIAAGEPHPFDGGRKARMHIGHYHDKSMGGSDEESNLRAVCSVCNEGASNLTLNRPQAIKLIAQVRRAPAKDQLDVLKKLIEKYPKQAESFLKSGR